MLASLVELLAVFQKLYDFFVQLTKPSSGKKPYVYTLYIIVKGNEADSFTYVATKTTNKLLKEIPAVRPLKQSIKFSKADAYTYIASIDIPLESLELLLSVLANLGFTSDTIAIGVTSDD